MSYQTRQLCSWFSILVEVAVQSLRTSACWSCHNPSLFMNFPNSAQPQWDPSVSSGEMLQGRGTIGTTTLCVLSENQKQSCLRAALPTLASLCQQDFIMVSGIRSFLIVLTSCSSKEQNLSMLWCFSWCFLVSWRGSVLCSYAEVTYLPICNVTVVFPHPCHLVCFVPLDSTCTLLRKAQWLVFALERFVFWLLPELLPYLRHIDKNE